MINNKWLIQQLICTTDFPLFVHVLFSLLLPLISLFWLKCHFQPRVTSASGSIKKFCVSFMTLTQCQMFVFSIYSSACRGLISWRYLKLVQCGLIYTSWNLGKELYEMLYVRVFFMLKSDIKRLLTAHS